MASKFKKIKKSIIARIVVPVLVLTFLQSSLVVALLYFNVIKNTIDNSMIKNFSSSVNVRKNYVESVISNTWSNFTSIYNEIVDETEWYLMNSSSTIDDVLQDKSLSEDYLNVISPYLNDIISENKVNDAYLILNNQYEDNTDRYMTYMRTKNPSYATNNEVDILYAPTKVWQDFHKQGYGLDNSIESNVYSDLENTDFYDKPVSYYQEHKKAQGYFSSLTNVKSDKVLSYSLPLIASNKLVGIIGVGVTESYLRTSLASLNKGEEINIAIVRKRDKKFSGYFTSFVDYSIPAFEDISFEKTEFADFTKFNKDGEVEYYFEDEINIYNNSNPFNEKWYVVGILPEKRIFRVSSVALRQILIIYCIAFVLILIIYVINAYFISYPIIKVSRSLDEKNVTNIPKTNITEVDNLIEKINNYSKKNVELNNKLNKVIQDSSLSIAFFDYVKSEDLVTVSGQFFELLQIDNKKETFKSSEFLYLLRSIDKNIVESSYHKDVNLLACSGEITFKIDDKYLQMKMMEQEDGIIATLIDQTMDFEKRKRIVHERDYDLLTGLLNRRGFVTRIQKIIDDDVNSSLFMIDIDNLKYINDQYGHEIGDAYLKKVGVFLKDLMKKTKNLYVCHISGDEFVLYLYNYGTIEEENHLIHLLRMISEEYLPVKNGKIFISLSIGVCHHEKGMSYEELVKRADYAMYIAKQDGKNTLRYFDDNAKNKFQYENIMYYDLNKIIDQKMVHFAYQPIVDIHTGDVLGYEALMRPLVKNLSPLSVLTAAKKYNRLYDIEMMTAFISPDKFFESNTDKKLFINSISSQSLTDEDTMAFLEKYKDYTDRFVIELIEEDMGQNFVIKRKTSIFDKYHISYAIDDYGTGYNNIGMILSYIPKYVKIEGSLIRDIDKDEKKQRLSKSIISYCAVNHIKVIAESVETIEELKMVRDLGVDYVQGYLLAKPEFEVLDLPEEKKKLIREI